MNRFFAPGGEFAGIERMFSADHFARDGRGLGDDGFVWEPAPGQTWVVSSDASVEGVHFRADWATRPQALRKALLANLSDINAMGGRTRLAFFNLCASPAYDAALLETLGAALGELETLHGFRVVGGDTTHSRDAEFFSFTVIGAVEGTPLLRSGGRPGHKIYASGTLGGSSAGLALFRDGGRAADPAAEPLRQALMRAHLEPAPPLELGPLLAALNGAGGSNDPAARSVAAIDISDGLSSELWHLARRSGCSLHVDFGKLPAHPALSALSPLASRAHVLHGGEEYQLLFTGDFSASELERMRALVPVSEIGVVESGEGVFLRENGGTHPLEAGGFSHG